jgi:hypothetical protein
MTDAEALAAKRENEYLKLRNAQLQSDLTDVSAEVQRLRRELERRGGLNALAMPNALGGA